MLKFNSLKAKLIIYFILTLLPILGILSFIAEDLLKSSLEKNAIENSRMLAFKAARNIEHLNANISSHPEMISKLYGERILDIKKIKILMKDFVKREKYIYGMAFALLPEYTKEKKPFCFYFYLSNKEIKEKELIPPNYNYFNFDWFKLPINSGKSMWSEPYYDKGGGEIWMCTYSSPIKNEKGEKIGIATADISISFLSRIISQIRVLKSGGAFLFTDKGHLLAPLMDESKIPESVRRILKSNIYINLKRTVTNIKDENGTEEKLSIEGKKFFILYIPIKNTNWFIGVVFPQRELFAPLHKIQLFFMIIILTGITFILFMIFFISQKLTKDVEKLKNISKEIASGNFNVKIPMDLSNEANDMAMALNAMQISLKKLLSKEKERARLENELELARKIQKSFIPESSIESHGDFLFQAKSIWAKEVGGDFYGINVLNEEEIIFYIGDVSGKGIPAALYVAILKSMVEVLIKQTSSISEIISFLNDYLSSITRHFTFATIFMGKINIKKGILKFCNAGHIPPIFFKEDRRLFSPKLNNTPPIGTFKESKFKVEEIKLEDFDAIFLYTDGLTDCESNNEQFGEERLIKLIFENIPRKEVLMENIHKSLKDYIGNSPLYDDTTILFISKK